MQHPIDDPSSWSVQDLRHPRHKWLQGLFVLCHLVLLVMLGRELLTDHDTPRLAWWMVAIWLGITTIVPLLFFWFWNRAVWAYQYQGRSDQLARLSMFAMELAVVLILIPAILVCLGGAFATLLLMWIEPPLALLASIYTGLAVVLGPIQYGHLQQLIKLRKQILLEEEKIALK